MIIADPQQSIQVTQPDRTMSKDFWLYLKNLTNGVRDAGGVRPEDFTRGSDGENIAQAIASGMADGVPVTMDGSYAISEPLATVAVDGTLAVRGSGLITISADFSTPAINLHATYPTPVAVTAVTATTRTFPGGSTATDATKLTAAGHGVAVGDLVKVVSDDVLAVHADANPRRGEFAYVADVSGNDIYVARLRDTYTTTVRLVRVRREAQIIWDGPRFAATPAQSGWDTVMMQVRGAYRPFVKSTFEDGYDVGLSLSSCFAAEAEITGRNFRNRVGSEGVSGYLLADSASAYTRASISGVDARHFYTTDVPNPGLNDEPYLYGKPIGASITGAGYASSAAAFDTHTECEGITFHNVVTGAARIGESASGTGIGMRGRRIQVHGGIDIGSSAGIQLHTEVADGNIDCEVVNWSYEGTGDGIGVNNTASFNAKGPWFRGVRISTSKNRSVVLRKIEGGVIDDLVLKPTSATTATGIVLDGDVSVLVRRLFIDLSGYTGAHYRCLAFDTATTGNSLVVERMRVVGASGKLEAFFNGTSTSGSVELIDCKSDVAPFAGDIINGGSLTSQTILGAMKPRSFAVASLPSAVQEGIGTIVWTTNGNTGAACPAISDGTDWKRITLGATVSAS